MSSTGYRALVGLGDESTTQLTQLGNPPTRANLQPSSKLTQLVTYNPNTHLLLGETRYQRFFHFPEVFEPHAHRVMVRVRFKKDLIFMYQGRVYPGLHTIL